ncbi:hypothetical protein NQD76_12440, partial [Escherichia coli]|nr:hypothetical protein [Escherichia coli]MDR6012720.1 hypothetical protein [Escherichia coli]
KRVFLVILFTSFSGSLVSRIPGAVQGKQLAQHNAQFLVEFMAKLSAELAGENEGVDHKVIDAFSPAG